MKIKLSKIKPQIIKAREFLARNKIFIEFFSFLVVGFAGIIFAFFQCKTNEMQLHVQEMEKQPLFKITFSTQIDSSSYYAYKSYEYTEVCQIFNLEYPMKDFWCSIITCYVVSNYINKKHG
jgi:thiamine pyrophosphokinase